MVIAKVSWLLGHKYFKQTFKLYKKLVKQNNTISAHNSYYIYILVPHTK